MTTGEVYGVSNDLNRDVRRTTFLHDATDGEDDLLLALAEGAGNLLRHHIGKTTKCLARGEGTGSVQYADCRGLLRVLDWRGINSRSHRFQSDVFHRPGEQGPGLK